MPPIIIKISIEGDPQGTIDALRRIASINDSDQILAMPEITHGELDPEPSGQGSAELTPRNLVELPAGDHPMFDSRMAGVAYRHPLPEPAWPARWDKQLGNELVRNMSENARRLVEVLAEAGSEGMTRDAITSQLGIETDTIRTTQVSIGHALRRVQRANGNISLPRPVEFHKRLDTYMLNPAFRAALQSA